MIIPGDRLGEEDEVMAQIRAGHGVRHFETVRRRKDGALLDISLTVSPIRAHSGAIIGASKIARDITQEKALRRAAAEISRVKDEFLATLSHELRTPLNTLLGYTQMMQTGALDPAAMAKALDAMTRNGQALVGLVNDVLDASRIVTGQMRLQLGPIDLAAVLEEAIETIRPTTMAKGLQLEVSVERDLMVNGDPDRLRQAFWNLLSNAAKFTPSGTRRGPGLAPGTARPSRRRGYGGWNIGGGAAAGVRAVLAGRFHPHARPGRPRAGAVAGALFRRAARRPHHRAQRGDRPRRALRDHAADAARSIAAGHPAGRYRASYAWAS